jgi:predicted ATPase/class 3 adenylate cyclase
MILKPSMRPDLPTGTVTFLFTDVEGSTKLLEEIGDEAYAEALSVHRRIVRASCQAHDGVEVDTQGDAFLVAFARATDAIAAAAAAQSQLSAGPLRVRMGLHTGEPLRTSESYVGLVVHKAARIAAAGHGSQILLSQATRDLAEVHAKDLGLHRLKDLDEPIGLYQLGEGDFPPLKSLHATNLPVPATPFIGRERELEDVVDLLRREDVHLVTLTGPGGTGKTRLALQAAAEASDAFPDGVTWVPLSSLRDPSLVLATVAHAVGVSEGAETSLVEKLKNALARKQTLLLLDNAEHLLPDAADDIALLAVAGSPVVLVTSRERLQLQGEHLYLVPTLSDEDGVELFVARAQALDRELESNGAISELCTRLENLPLAVELAAARTSLFTPEQLLGRLAERLDLLKGGRDADPRQQTLRATIQWSYDLLDEEERRLFRHLSVFAGGCTYEAAEEVCAGTPDTLQSLIDKSLVRRRQALFGPRYWMLETIREYADERLEEAAEAAVAARRHAEWVCELAERVVGMPPKKRLSDSLAPFPDELDNARRGLGWAWANGEHELAVRFGPACLRLWMNGGLYRDAVSWLEHSLTLATEAPPQIALDALRAQGVIAFAVLANTELADDCWTRGLELARKLGRTDEAEWLEASLASVAWERGDLRLAMRLRQEGLARARERGDRFREAQYLHWIGEIHGELARFDDAERDLLEAEEIYGEVGDDASVSNNVHSRADLALDRADFSSAAQLYRRALALDRGGDADASPSHTAYCLAGLASVLVGRRDDVAAMLWGAVCAAEENLGFRMIGRERQRYETRLARLENTDTWLQGRELTLAEAEELVAPALSSAGL